jgi:hypothetical protein
MPWGCNGAVIPGADGTAIGTGAQNTFDIMSGCSETSIAARICGDLVLGGYSDWYLPSINELNMLFINKVAIGGFVCSRYWSSTEIDSNTAWVRIFYNGGVAELGNKTSTWCVRAVRSF